MHNQQLTMSASRYRQRSQRSLNRNPQVFVRHESRVVKRDPALAINQNKRWRGARTVFVEIELAHGDWDLLESRIIVLPYLPYIGEFVRRTGVLPVSSIAVVLSRSFDLQAS